MVFPLHNLLSSRSVSPLASLLPSWLLSEDSKGKPRLSPREPAQERANVWKNHDALNAFSGTNQAKPERKHLLLTWVNLSKHSPDLSICDFKVSWAQYPGLRGRAGEGLGDAYSRERERLESDVTQHTEGKGLRDLQGPAGIRYREQGKLFNASVS